MKGGEGGCEEEKRESRKEDENYKAKRNKVKVKKNCDVPANADKRIPNPYHMLILLMQNSLMSSSISSEAT